ncbi:MAG: hypothetical protein J1F69_03300 [Clostridiales bacterium]|nr:hypothetical protein [Clostridiales bacterium]
MKKTIKTAALSLTILSVGLFSAACGEDTPRHQHNFVEHYCTSCGTAQPPESFDDLIFFYEDDLINAAKTNNQDDVFDYSYSVCILENEEAVSQIQSYSFSPDLTESEIISGLFVKCTAKLSATQEVVYEAYYNYGLQLNTKYNKIDVSTTFQIGPDTHTESWSLLPLEKNKKIYFEFEILND